MKAHSKLKGEWGKEFELLLQSRPELKIRFPERGEETNDDKFLIHDSQRKDFKPDTFVQRFNMSIKVKVVGKHLTLEIDQRKINLILKMASQFVMCITQRMHPIGQPMNSCWQ